MRRDGRRFQSELAPLLKVNGEGLIVLRAPAPGYVRHAPQLGRVLRPGELLCELEVLSTIHAILVPDSAAGSVVQENAHTKLARKPVAYGDVIAVLDPKVGSSEGLGIAALGAAAGTTGLVWKTPLGGRYYGRSSPAAEPFVKVGDVIKVGQTVALIEVMKTFNRASYGGAGLPEEARVKRIVAKEGDDVSAGDVILELE